MPVLVTAKTISCLRICTVLLLRRYCTEYLRLCENLKARLQVRRSLFQKYENVLIFFVGNSENGTYETLVWRDTRREIIIVTPGGKFETF